MKLLKLKLENFQGIRSLAIETEGDSINVFGDNATGKTTIYNAITWLLFDKSSTGAKNFSSKTRGADGEELHNLEHSAEGTFRYDDGKIVTFKKCLHEVYRQKRGSAESEFTGNTIDYYINGVPVKANMYQAEITLACGPIDQTMMILMPDYFAETMSWQDRRKVLLSVCGDKTDDEIIASDPKLYDLKELLLIDGTTDQYHSVEDFKAMQTAKMKEINRRLDEIPTRIDEAAKAVKDAEGLDRFSVSETIATFESKLRNVQTGNNTPDDVSEKIAELNAWMENAKHEWMTGRDKRYNEAKEEAISFAELTQSLYPKKRDTANNLTVANEELDRRKKLREDLIGKLKELTNLKWDTANEVCPTCGQRLPEGKIESAKKAFEDDRNAKIKELNAKGRAECTTQILTQLEHDKEVFEKSLADYVDKYEEATAQELEATSKMQKILAETFEETETYQKLKAEKEAVLNSIPEEKPNTEAESLKAELDSWKAKLVLLDLADAQNERIKELETEETKLAKEYQKCERAVYLCDLFIRVKVKAINDSINEHFHNVRFRLFIEQINGGIKEDCEVLIPCGERLIPYTFANTASRMNAGLEIISVLSKAFGRTMPVIVDNAEAISPHNWKTIPGTQMIRLYVSENDKTLRIEKEI